MKTGMLAAETAFDAVVAGDTSEARLGRFRREDPSELGRAPKCGPVQHVHQAFKYGLFGGLAFAGLQMLTKGWWIRSAVPSVPGHLRMRRLDESGSSPSECPS